MWECPRCSILTYKIEKFEKKTKIFCCESEISDVIFVLLCSVFFSKNLLIIGLGEKTFRKSKVLGELFWPKFGKKIHQGGRHSQV